MVNIPTGQADRSKEQLADLIRSTFRTRTGRALAERVFLKEIAEDGQ